MTRWEFVYKLGKEAGWIKLVSPNSARYQQVQK